jgi:hypothetical protein
LSENVQKRKEFCNYSHKIAVQFQQKSHYGVIEELLERYKNHS